MTKAYWIARVAVSDTRAYARYAADATAAFAQFGGRALARGGNVEVLEGDARERNVVIEFDGMSTALECYHSDAYQRARRFREGAADIDLILVEGVS